MLAFPGLAILEDLCLNAPFRYSSSVFAFPGKDRNANAAAMGALRRDPGWRKILHEDSALRAPREDQRFNHYGGLDGFHCEYSQNSSRLKRLFGRCTCCASPSAGHFDSAMMISRAAVVGRLISAPCSQ